MKKPFLFLFLIIPRISFGQNKPINKITPINASPINPSEPTLIQPKLINNDYVFEEIINCPKTSKNELFKRAKIWCETSFKNPSAVLSSSDEQTGIITLNPGFSFTGKKLNGYDDDDYGKCTMVIEFKDNKYRYKISDISVSTASFEPMQYNSLYTWKAAGDNHQSSESGLTILSNALYKGTIMQVNLLINSLKEGMNISSKNDNW